MKAFHLREYKSIQSFTLYSIDTDFEKLHTYYFTPEMAEVDLCTPPELRDLANSAKSCVIPSKTKHRYENAYNLFKKWQVEKNAVNVYSENVFLAFFREGMVNKSPNTLWSEFSMIRAMVNLKDGIDISKSKYPNLFALLKNNSKGYKPKKAAVFEDYDIKRFFESASDDEHLVSKVRSFLYFVIIFHCIVCKIICFFDSK